MGDRLVLWRLGRLGAWEPYLLCALDTKYTMDDQEFLDRIKAKLERLAGTEIQLELDTEDQEKLRVELRPEVPVVTLGSNVLEYSGFARMAIEYVVASIRTGRELQTLEFQMLLSRN